MSFANILQSTNVKNKYNSSLKKYILFKDLTAFNIYAFTFTRNKMLNMFKTCVFLAKR